MLAVSMPTAAMLLLTRARAASAEIPGKCRLSISGAIAAKVGELVWPARGPVATYEHDGVRSDGAVRSFERLQVADLEQCVRVGPSANRDIDHYTRGDQASEWDLIGGGLALRKMDRSVEMGSAMLGRRKSVGGIEVASFGGTHDVTRELKPRALRGPIHGLAIEGMSQLQQFLLSARYG